MDRAVLKEFMQLPGVGKSMAQDLWQLGFRSLADVASANPEAMYRDLETLAGAHVDRCVLYVFRCAVYYAANTSHDPELLKWWNWKDPAPHGKR